ncbi:PREDICTED: galactoside 3(4)-L-fucosyltransferase-like [Acropora digitifera]|uniref:galactoside 3(4)-L-fucosyltransferase-like n=1 Tax=Acropora digitifera TaxID=70779 RepID=UPI00077A05CE|nr:PREDICTED: galactoside 3(4)-L-fucosyltransferase-like [Acropora digitifera]
MTENKRLVLLAIVMGAAVIITVQQWLLPNEFARIFMLRKDETNPAIANIEQWPLESDIAKSSMFRKKEANSSITKHAMKVILFYTTWFGSPNWPGFDAEQNVSCGQLTCRLTHNRDELQKSNAVIFHGRDLPSGTVLKEVEKSKPSKQRWIYFLMESPLNAGR